MLPSDLLQSVLDALPTPVFFKDRGGVYQGCNMAFSRTLGKTPDEMRGRSVFDLWPPELATIYADADETLMSSGTEQHYETQIELPNGERRHVVFYKAVVRDAENRVTGLVGTLLDITERKALEQRLTNLAQRDALTGLLNRRAIMEQLDNMHADRRATCQSICVMMCDIDHFKRINDEFGHAAGDEVLRATAHILRMQLRDGDVLGRMGGEEFLVVLPDTTLALAREIAERLRQSVASARVLFEAATLQVTVSIGLSYGLLAEAEPDTLIRRADANLYKAKHGGRNRVIAEPLPT